MFSPADSNKLASAIRAARSALNWSQRDLAHHSRISLPTIGRVELGEISPRLQTAGALFDTFEKAGISFHWSDRDNDFVMTVAISQTESKKRR